MSNTFNNLESLGSIRAKLNATTLTVEDELVVKKYDYTAGADNESGNVSAITANTISDATKSWLVNQWAGYAVKMVDASGNEDYGIVLSNTATQLTFDDNHANYVFTTYRILSTFNVQDLTSVISFNITSNDAAIILPSVSLVEDRGSTFIYLEVADGTKGLAIICTGANRQRGLKWGKLIYQYEGVELLAHQTAFPHWDIRDLFGIKRYGSFYTSGNLPVASATYAQVLTFASTVLAQSKRFELLNVSGVAWLKYQSIIAQDFRLSGSIPVQRTGGGTTLIEFKVRVKRFATGLNEDTVIKTLASFSGDETKTIPIDIPFSLQPYDQITLIAQRDAGTINILAGASFVFTEM